MADLIPPWQSAFLENGKVTQPWIQFFMRLSGAASGGSGGGGGGGGGAGSADLSLVLQQTVDIDGLESKIDGVYATALTSATGNVAAGDTNQIQFNNNGVFDASSNLTFTDGLTGSRLTLNRSEIIGNENFVLNAPDKIDDDTEAGAISLFAGTDQTTGVVGASVVLLDGAENVGGDAAIVGGNIMVGSTGSKAGDVIIKAGDVESSETYEGTAGSVQIVAGTGFEESGHISLLLSDVNALTITENGEWAVGVGAERGLEGQALVSWGENGGSPSWQDVANSVEITSSEGDFTIDPTGPQTGDVSIDVVLNTVPIDKGGTGQTDKTAAFDALSPLTTKGDIVVFDGTNNVRLPVGMDNQVLIASSSSVNGLEWVTTRVLDIPFQYNVVSPFPLITVPAGILVKSITTYIEEPFDDLSATVSIGVVVDPEQLQDNITPDEGVAFQCTPIIQYGVDTEVFLYVNPGVSTQGSGLISIELQERG